MSLSKKDIRKKKAKVLVHPAYNSEAKHIKQTEESKGSKVKAKRITLFSSAILCIFAFLLLGNIYWANLQLDKELAEYERQFQELKFKEATLIKEIDMLNDPIYIEKLAREKLGFVRTGERVIVPAKPGEISPVQEGEKEIRH